MIVYTGGTFDLLHAGHINFLSQCAMLGSVTVSLNTDSFIMTYKGEEPVFCYEDRAYQLELLPFVDNVIPNSGGADSKPAIEQVKPDYIAIGSDWARKNYYEQMGFTQDWLDERGISLVYIPYTPHVSSTLIKQRIRNDR